MKRLNNTPVNKALIVDDKKSIVHIQEKFSQMFPYLKLLFYSNINGNNKKALFDRLMKNTSKTIGEYKSVQQKGSLTITPEMTVHELEKEFNTLFGLHVNVLRNTGNAWIDTSITNSWTLFEQNKQGEELSK